MTNKIEIELTEARVLEVLEEAAKGRAIQHWAQGITVCGKDGAFCSRYAVACTVDDHPIEDELSRATVRTACREILTNPNLAAYRRHVFALLLGAADATTYDVIAQVAVLGEVVYR